MSIAGIQTRNPERDRRTDLARLERLTALLRLLQAEVESESAGLRRRYNEAQDAAAFALEAFENGGGEELSTAADQHGERMRRYQDRVIALGTQKTFLHELEEQVAQFSAGLKN
jgi:protein-tyrosine-phosphatase